MSRRTKNVVRRIVASIALAATIALAAASGISSTTGTAGGGDGNWPKYSPRSTTK
jgi:hypothetical protein